MNIFNFFRKDRSNTSFKEPTSSKQKIEEDEDLEKRFSNLSLYQKQSAVDTNDLDSSMLQILQPLTKCTDPESFYTQQAVHNLGSQQDVYQVSIYIQTSNIKATWLPHIDNAIRQINEAAPGIHLFKNNQRWQAKIWISNFPEHEGSWTLGNVFHNNQVKISLCPNWEPSRMKRTSTHEILHALGFHHEHQRSDCFHYLEVKNSQSSQYKPQYNGLTPFDPYSIMIYNPDKTSLLKKKDAKIWALKSDYIQNNQLSQLDKIGLNLLYKPCQRNGKYEPRPSKNNSTLLFYCGRYVMDGHNKPASSTTDGRCGPNNGPNCPSCRVLKNPKLKDKMGSQRWQGWSGLVYCGNYFGKMGNGHDGYCGPNNGISCAQCQKFLD